MSATKGNGKNGSAEWDSKDHNKSFSRLFSSDKVAEVKAVDLKDKDDYDALDGMVERIRRARDRLRGRVPKKDNHEDSGV